MEERNVSTKREKMQTTKTRHSCMCSPDIIYSSLLVNYPYIIDWIRATYVHYRLYQGSIRTVYCISALCVQHRLHECTMRTLYTVSVHYAYIIDCISALYTVSVHYAYIIDRISALSVHYRLYPTPLRLHVCNNQSYFTKLLFPILFNNSPQPPENRLKSTKVIWFPRGKAQKQSLARIENQYLAL